MLTEKQVEHICDIIDRKFYFEREGDSFSTEMFADYRDEFDKATILKIVQDSHPREKFWDIISEAYFDHECYEYKEVMDQLEKSWDADKYGEYCEVEDDVNEWVNENVSFYPPEDHYLNQDVCVNITIDTGDGNYDFTLNCIYPHYSADADECVNDKSSILWLAQQQGYTKQRMCDAFKSDEPITSPLLNSLYSELVNCSSSINVLTFLVQMSLGDLLDMKEAIEDKTKGIVISKDTRCGLCDFWSGAGSVVEIELENDVVVPVEFIDSIMPDGGRGRYGIEEVYGVSSSFWNGTAKVIEIQKEK